jgi:hypothetical protein
VVCVEELLLPIDIEPLLLLLIDIEPPLLESVDELPELLAVMLELPPDESVTVEPILKLTRATITTTEMIVIINGERIPRHQGPSATLYGPTTTFTFC